MTKFLMLVAALSAASMVVPAVPAQTSANAPASSVFKVVSTPNGHAKPFNNDLHSASGSSASDIWAVGQTAIHFDGSKWTAFSVPLIKGDNTSRLGGVVDFAPDNAWTVGFTGAFGGIQNQVIEHFDGTKWKLSAGPKFQPGDEPALESLTATSTSDMWAGGFILTGGTQALLPLFEHFDGRSWTAFEDQSSNDASIFGVSAYATNDVWAAGTVAVGQTFIEHFDGKTWSVVPSPAPVWDRTFCSE